MLKILAQVKIKAKRGQQWQAHVKILTDSWQRQWTVKCITLMTYHNHNHNLTGMHVWLNDPHNKT